MSSGESEEINKNGKSKLDIGQGTTGKPGKKQAWGHLSKTAVVDLHIEFVEKQMVLGQLQGGGNQIN